MADDPGITVDLDQGDFPSVLAGALVRAQLKVRGLDKDAKNAFHGYSYASAESVMAEARAALNAADLAVLRNGWALDASYGHETTVQGAKGARLIRCTGRLFVRFDLLHSSGARRRYEVSIPVIPEAGKSDDKAELAALTTATSYFLLGLLQIPRDGGAGDIDQRSDGDEPRPGPVAPCPPAPPSQPKAQRDPDLRAALLQRIASARGTDDLKAVRIDAEGANTDGRITADDMAAIVGAYNPRARELREQAS